jgi:RND family efflux transporter MFP subunit
MNIEPGFDRERADFVELDAEDALRTRRKRRLIIGGAILLIALIAAALLLRGGETPPPAATALPRVTVIVPGRQTVTNMISATGTLAARREMPVGVAGEGGMIARVLVEPGDWVRAGQTLATIERSVQAEEANALAASIRVARADAALAESELDRARQLVARGFISKADIDRKTATRDAALARVNVAQAQLGEQRARIGRLDIRSPASGLVLTRAVEPGQVVGAGQGALFRVAKSGEMELLAKLAETDLAQLRAGVPADVTPVGTTVTLQGLVWQLSPVIDPQTRQGVARIALAYDKAIRPGGFASARIASGTVDAPLLPESAVQSDDKGNFVYVVGKGDKVERRAVKTGQVSDKGITILSGVAGNEQVVLSAGAFLSPGDKIIPERQAARR